MSTELFIIAEAGSNWRSGAYARDRQMGQALIEGAAEAGADAVKFQMYRAATVYAPNAGAYEGHCGQDLEDIGKTFEDLEMSTTLLEEFSQHAARCNIEFMCTPFSVEDLAAVDPHVRRHKMASYEMLHLRIWEAMIRTEKPVIFSTGGFTLADVDRILDWLVSQNAPIELYTVMHCVASYPAELSSLGLDVLRTMKERFGRRGLQVGYSDHSLDPVVAPAAAVALGATCIEKHFTLNRHLPGPDHPFAIEVPELVRMVKACRETFAAVEEHEEKGTGPAEKKLQRFAHRALQAIRDVAAGDILREGENFAILRPGNNSQGASPLEIDRIEGRRANVSIPRGGGILTSNVE
ncbi:MAG TPA: N-acetylneuraminate synthase family protein [Thermoanaerobaculia bacterium]|nr:N-acetylneuraminate synthase family protein [Thermoanaerobaculia bacterium]